MKGFRDLDPGEAEQVVTTRRRKIEYLEEELYAPLMDGYDAAPSESAPKKERPKRASKPAGPNREEPAQDSEPYYEEPRSNRRVSYKAGEYSQPLTDKKAEQPRRPAERSDDPYEAYNRARKPAESYDDPYEAYDQVRRSATRSDDPYAAYDRARKPAESYDDPYEAYDQIRRSVTRSDDPYEAYDRARRPVAGRDISYEAPAYDQPHTSAKRADDQHEVYMYEQPRASVKRPGDQYETYKYDQPRASEKRSSKRSAKRSGEPYRADIRYEQQEVSEDPYYEYDEDPGGEDFFYEDLTQDDRRGRRRDAAPMRRHTALIIRNAVLVTAMFAAVIACIVVVSGQIRKRNVPVQPEPEKKEVSLPPVDELPAGEEWTGENGGGAADLEPEEPPEEPETLTSPSEEAGIFFEGYEVHETGSTVELTEDDVRSEFAVLIDMKTGEVIAGRKSDEVIAPASMTKILTLLVATEHLTGQEKLDDTTIMTQEIGDLVYRKDLSAVGYKVGDVIPVRDLLYGTILPSGADAAMMLAEYVAGSQEAFVDMMNEKVSSLGLSETAHFANVVGLYDPDNHCTVKDMAMILKAAVENDLCREVLSAHIYTTAPTQEHPDGIEISNWFLRRIEDKDTHGDVICAKTGFVDQSGCCAASYQISNTGGRYICVTGNTWSSWQCIYDHVGLYARFT